MSLNMHDRLVILRSAGFQTRCAAAVIKFAAYILGGGSVGGVTPESAKQWAKESIGRSDEVAYSVSHYLLGDGNFTGEGATAGTDMSDADLSGAMEAAIRTNYMTAA